MAFRVNGTLSLYLFVREHGRNTPTDERHVRPDQNSEAEEGVMLRPFILRKAKVLSEHVSPLSKLMHLSAPCLTPSVQVC